MSYRIVSPPEAPALAELMRAYYAFDGHDFDETRVLQTLAEFLASPDHGRAWFIEEDGAIAGYMVICFGFSLSFGGRDAFVDEIYLHEPFRGRGLGRDALTFMIAEAKRFGIKALHLEVNEHNVPAQRLYTSLGFERGRFRLMSRPL